MVSAHPPTGHAGGFRKHLLTALPVIIALSLATLFLEERGWLEGFETAALDTWLRISEPVGAKFVRIVDITDADYDDPHQYDSVSPLKKAELDRLLALIIAGNPAVIAVDIDTSSKDWLPERARQPVAGPDEWTKPAIIWSRAGTFDGKTLHPHKVLGSEDPLDNSGLAVFPLDWDGRVRRYRGVFQIGNEEMDSFPWAITKAYCNRPGVAAAQGRPITSILETAKEQREGKLHDERELVLNFPGDRFAWKRMTAAQVLAAGTGPGWSKNGPLTGRIVILGGTYSAARDNFLTPGGTVPGVQLIAQAVESELRGKGIGHAEEFLMWLIDLLIGVALVAAHFYLSPRLALITSIVFLPVLALAGSFLAFSSLAYWVNFVPMLFGMLIHQLYDHLKEYRRLCKDLESKLAKEHHGT